MLTNVLLCQEKYGITVNGKETITIKDGTYKHMWLKNDGRKADTTAGEINGYCKRREKDADTEHNGNDLLPTWRGVQGMAA